MVEQHYTSQEKGHEKPLPAEADFAAALRRADVCDGYPSEQPAKHIKSLRDFGEFLLDSTVVRSFRSQLAPGYLNLSFLLLGICFSFGFRACLRRCLPCSGIWWLREPCWLCVGPVFSDLWRGCSGSDPFS